jgi:hypothetical protein
MPIFIPWLLANLAKARIPSERLLVWKACIFSTLSI